MHWRGDAMKQTLQKLLENRLFLLLINGTVGYMAFIAVIITVLQVPPEALLDSNLKEVLLVFEEFP
jgi:flagellar biosynthesis/type III secretory pathway M-ring protein FliF/YscJ